ncbi:MAG TPA: DNA internalization-related competence protein ComEC/Rec2 [Rhodocyclaceae bacterium]|nr:DNA internalization-related competence protein ComEC/Rec2 [Rhodocyclaceae bacterium]
MQATLTPVWVWSVASVFIAILVWLSHRLQYGKLRLLFSVIAACTLGLAYATWRAEIRLADALPLAMEGQDVHVIGSITDLPQAREHGIAFLFNVDPGNPSVPRMLSLAWYAEGRGAEQMPPPNLRAGQRWQLTVRLKRPHGNLNPAGFDYEGWMFERGVRATGYVRQSSDNRMLAEPQHGFLPTIDRMRESIRDRFRAALPNAPWAGVLIALAVGDQASITADQWKLFSQTGVTHLMSISGSHITLFAALVAWIMRFAWRCFPRLGLRLPAQKAAVLAGALAAAFYVALAGFGVPAQRTLYMLMVVALALWFGRGSQALRTLLFALLVVLLIDPWAVLSAGFWLSFAAVGVLMLIAAGRFGKDGFVMAWLRAQWAIVVISLPLLLGIFQQFSLVSPLANVIAIPVVSAVITPLALLFAAVPLTPFAQLAHWLLALMMKVLAWMASWPVAVRQQAAPPGWLVALAVLAGLWALLPRGVPGRWTALLVFPVMLAWSPPRPAMGEMKMTVIDVGQGLSVHVQTARHDFLFDAGPQYSEDSDSGQRIIVPYLRAQGVRHLDGMFISHNDNDHFGGAASVFDAVPVDWWESSLPADHPLRQRPNPHVACARGQTWQWDSVRFEVLHPTSEFATRKDNDRSCVLHVSAMHGSALLTGDIETPSERDILAWSPREVRADVLIAPHHGSNTSSHQAFVDAVGARVVVFPVGYRNRFHHPAPAVVERYAQTGARLSRSDFDGAVTFMFEDRKIDIRRERVEQARYWHGQ